MSFPRLHAFAHDAFHHLFAADCAAGCVVFAVAFDFALAAAARKLNKSSNVGN